MLFLPPGTGKLQRIHGAFVADGEISGVVEHLRRQSPPDYEESVFSERAEGGGASGDWEEDQKYDEAVAIVAQSRQASISLIQRRLRIGYNRAARIIERMEEEGVISPAVPGRPREVLVPEPPPREE